ncbi:hypothetical protein VHEMI06289 [[Torrubiella] hemipterigena]|uniref:Tubulin-specific chaperone A n=1 Tax=[Torrubiella] hemipterigena TaxID=1531966 RepID=A0A0A1T066_9HYPO|nr:hypothetical protein VHEMI06289 [[Torrubiella] hemipterigena]
MPAPSALAIATGSVQRLLKEEASYHKELADQEKQIKTLEEQIKSGKDDEDGNAPYMLKQQQTAAEQTRAVFGPLKKRIEDAVAKLQDQITAADETVSPGAELDAAKAILAQATAA